MLSRISLVFTLCLLPFYATATAYYEITSPTGETTYQPFFSLPAAPGYFNINPSLVGGGAVAFVVTLSLLYCCSSGAGGTFLRTADFEDKHSVEEDPVIAEPAKKNVTKKTRRAVNLYQNRIIQDAQEPGRWYAM